MKYCVSLFSFCYCQKHCCADYNLKIDYISQHGTSHKQAGVMDILDVDNMIEASFNSQLIFSVRSFSCFSVVINSFRIIWEAIISFLTNLNHHLCSPLLWPNCYQGFRFYNWGFIKFYDYCFNKMTLWCYTMEFQKVAIFIFGSFQAILGYRLMGWLQTSHLIP